VRVLVIEDDEAIRSVVERGLRAEGFDVDTCGDGASGLNRAIDGAQVTYAAQAVFSRPPTSPATAEPKLAPESHGPQPLRQA
jgi:CheY-like chemotaxis protein